jgi:hypothetical protein
MTRTKLCLRRVKLKRYRGDPGKRYGLVKIMKAIEASGGRLALAARKLGCSPKTLWDYKNKYPQVEQLIRDQRELFLDEAEDALQAAVRKHESWAVCFLLKCLGKERGYMESGFPAVQQVIVSQRKELSDDPYKAAASVIKLLADSGVIDASMFEKPIITLPAPLSITGNTNGNGNGYHGNGEHR